MKAAIKALVPTLALAAALALPSVAEAGHRHGPRCGHRGYSSERYYSRGYRHAYPARPYAYSYRYRPYRPGYYGRGHGYAPMPYGYGYDGYYPPPPPYRPRPRLGVSFYFGF